MDDPKESWEKRTGVELVLEESGFPANFFDLQGHRREELPYYEEAEESAVQCRQQLSTWTDKRKARIQIGKDGTAPSKVFLLI